VLRVIERAVIERSDERRRQLMTVVVVGGGPTGVELAGALAELKRHVLPNDYPRLDLSPARVILLEATDRLLSAFPARLQRRALDQLRELGVEVRLSTSVASVTAEGVTTSDGVFIAAHTVAWVAGVRGESLGEHMGLPVQRDGRVPVEPALNIPGRNDTYVIGDLASLPDPDGKPYPMLAPVAIQQGRLAAQNILHRIDGRPPTTFRYRDRGIMATIGRRKAVAHVFGLQLSGFIAWFMWLTVHLLQIVGLRNRALVLLNWIWNYVRYDRANRLVTDERGPGQ
jgi:NADH dehydrogenase